MVDVRVSSSSLKSVNIQGRNIHYSFEAYFYERM
jgi:hypothetical protein